MAHPRRPMRKQPSTIEIQEKRRLNEDFRQTYDARNWIGHLYSLHASVFPRVVLRCLFFFTWSLAITVLDHFVHVWESSTDPHVIGGAALSLLIVFRTNSSYGRFWEGRAIFGQVFARCRDLTRNVVSWIDGPIEYKFRIVNFLIVFPFALKRHLRAEESYDDIKAVWDSPELLRLLRKSSHVPNSCLQKITEQLAAARNGGLMSDYVAMSLNQGVTELMTNVAAAEKISRTPIPYAYTIEGTRFLFFYLLTLPIPFVHQLKWGTPFVTFLLAYALLGIEQIGVEIEEPFGDDPNDLPLDRMCREHHIELVEMIGVEKTYISGGGSKGGASGDGGVNKHMDLEGGHRRQFTGVAPLTIPDHGADNFLSASHRSSMSRRSSPGGESVSSVSTTMQRPTHHQTASGGMPETLPSLTDWHGSGPRPGSRASETGHAVSIPVPSGTPRSQGIHGLVALRQRQDIDSNR